MKREEEEGTKTKHCETINNYNFEQNVDHDHLTILSNVLISSRDRQETSHPNFKQNIFYFIFIFTISKQFVVKQHVYSILY
jgi:hypothetical protein